MECASYAADRKGEIALRNLIARLATAALALSCASPGLPPGGPNDAEAPQLIRIAPDSGRTGTTPREVIFRFDEVVSERPAGVPSLEALFLISPRDGTPRIDWNREEVAVRPRRGWRPNTAYTVTLLPGITDLRGNVRNSGAMTVFATGAVIPTARISGIVYNWSAGVGAPGALVEAFPNGDTTSAYVAIADSAGAFTLPNVPPGRITLRGVMDANRNRALDPREQWDTVTLSLMDSARAELYAFTRDSLGVSLGDVRVVDSVTLRLGFTSALDPSQRFSAASVTVTRADSVRIPVASVAAPPADTTQAAPGQLRMSRPIPSRELVVRLAAPLRGSAMYRVRVVEVRGLGAPARSSERVITLEVPPAVASPPPRP